MNFNQYQKEAARTMNKNLNGHQTLMHSLHGLAAEVGELHGIYQKVYQGHDLDLEHVRKEIGDIFWMLAELCTVYGFKMEDIAMLNIKKLKARFPDGFEAERSLHRVAGDI